MDLRVQLMQDYEQGESIAALAEIYEVSRKTIYKWLERYGAQGVEGLRDLSRAPRHSPRARRRGGRGDLAAAGRANFRSRPDAQYPAQKGKGDVGAAIRRRRGAGCAEAGDRQR